MDSGIGCAKWWTGERTEDVFEAHEKRLQCYAGEVSAKMCLCLTYYILYVIDRVISACRVYYMSWSDVYVYINVRVYHVSHF